MSISSPRRFALESLASRRRRDGRARRGRPFAPRPEPLEGRITPTTGLTVAQIREAYGLNSLANFGAAKADGSGQTIAIVVPGNDPTILGDLDDFDQAMSLSPTSNQTLYQQYGPATSTVTVYNQKGQDITSLIGGSGSNGVPGLTDDQGDIIIDVEWAHAIAPGAKIALLETNGDAMADRLAGDLEGTKLPGVSVLACTYGDPEFAGEAALDASTFTAAAGHQGVTFVGGAGFQGYGVTNYPGTSPDVISVGETQLALNGDEYGGETSWDLPAPFATDYGSSQYSQVGPWAAQAGGFGGKYATAPAGSAAVATWMAPVFGTTSQLSATWTASPANATNATYLIYDGSAAPANLLGTVTVDQTKPPVGVVDGGSQFQVLGTYTQKSGTLVVVLDAATANGSVVADAVGTDDSNAGGGGPSDFEAEPTYQAAVQHTGRRTTPDVSWDDSPESPLLCFENGVEESFWGNTPAGPSWTALFAIANQGRVADGLATFNPPADPQQALQSLYAAPASDFHDITTGYTGVGAGPGYDEATGLGSPIANRLVPYLVAYDPSARVVVSAQPPGSATAGAGFGLSVEVEDAAGAPLASYQGGVTLALAANPGGGGLGGTLTATAVDGVATFSGLTLDVAADGYVIAATAAGAGGASTRPFDVQAGPGEQLVLSTQPPRTVVAEQVFGLVVSIQDAFGNIAAGDDEAVTLALATGPAGSILAGATTVHAADGVATFSGLGLNKAGAGITLEASLAGSAGVATAAILVTPAEPEQVVVLQQPTGVVAGAPISLEVAIEDPFGNVEAAENGASVVASIGAGTGPLSGATTLATAGGLAGFTLADTRAGVLQLAFRSGLLATVVSRPILVSPATPAKLVVQVEPSATAALGQPLATQPVIDEEDQYGNLEAGDSSTVVSASLATGNGPLLGTTSAVVSGGVARFTNLADHRIETIALKFAEGQLPVATSSPVLVEPTVGDYDGDGKADVAIYDQAAATFYIDESTGKNIAFPIGNPNHVNIPIAGDYDGDGKADVAIYDQAAATFYIDESTGPALTIPFGNPGHLNVPVAGDYDGSGRADLAIYDRTAATFYIVEAGGREVVFPIGNPAHVNIPVAGDYDGDGKTDVAIYDQAGSTFYIDESTGKAITYPYGNPGHLNVPIAGDYDGDGKTDVAIYDRTAAVFYVAGSSGGTINLQYGPAGDGGIPIAADFAGTGRADIAVFDPSTAEFFVLSPVNGGEILPLGNKKHANLPI